MTTSERMARVRQSDTAPEKALRRVLWSRGHRYRVKSQLAGRPDLVFPRARLAVFVDGCFWHGCPEHYVAPKANEAFWLMKLKGNVARDTRTNERLDELGWTVLRIWEHEVTRNLDEVIATIEALLLPPPVDL